MSEGIHREFRAASARLASAVLAVAREGRQWWALVERPAAFRRGVAPGLDGTWAVPRISAGDGATQIGAAVELANSMGIEANAAQLAPCGRWESPVWTAERWIVELFLVETVRQPSESRHWVRVDRRPRGAGSVADGEIAAPALTAPALTGPALAAPSLAADYAGPLLGAVLDCASRPGVESFADWADAMAQRAAAHPGPVDRLALAPGAWVLPQRTPTLPPATHTNCVLFAGERLIVVDPASPYEDEQARLHAFIEDFVAAGVPLNRIVLTHHHRDHVGGVEALRKLYSVPVAAHPETASLLPNGPSVDEFLEDGDRIVLGSTGALDVLHTPGHAPGHIVLVDDRTGAAALGDMVAGDSTIVVDPPLGNMDQYLLQLARLEARQFPVAVAAHGGVLLDPTRRLFETRRHRVWREGVILAALQTGGPQRIEALLPATYGDVDPRALPIALRQLLAHLEKLEEDGRVVRSGAKWGATAESAAK